MKKGNVSFRKKLFRMVSVGVIDEPINQMYDILTTAALIVNLTVKNKHITTVYALHRLIGMCI